MPHPERVSQLMCQDVDGTESRRGVRHGPTLGLCCLRSGPELCDHAAECFVTHGSGARQAQGVVLGIAPVGVEQVDARQVNTKIPVPGLGCWRV